MIVWRTTTEVCVCLFDCLTVALRLESMCVCSQKKKSKHVGRRAAEPHTADRQKDKIMLNKCFSNAYMYI